MKRTLPLALSISLLLAAAFSISIAHAGLVTLPAGSSVCQGATVAVPIGVAPLDDNISMKLVIEFDPTVVQPTNVVGSAITAGCTVDWNVTGMGDELSISFVCLFPTSGSGTVAYVYLLGVGASGASTPLHWQTAEVDDVPQSTSDGLVAIDSGTSTLQMPPAIGAAGGIVDVPLLGDLASGSIGIIAELHWDTAVLTAISAEVSQSLPADCALDFNPTGPGAAFVSVYCTTPLSGPQQLANLTFQVGGVAGAHTSLDLVAGAVNDADACLEDGLFTVVSGAVVRVPASTNVCTGADVVVPISVSPADDVEALGLALQYDPAVVAPIQVVLGPLTAGHGCALDWNTPAAGQLAIGILCLSPLSGSGTAANVVFQGVGAPPAASALTWLQHELNEGLVPSSHQNGTIHIVSGGSTLSMPASTQAGSGGMVDVPLKGDLASGTIGVSAVVSWDPALLTAVSVAIGPALPPTWSLDYDLSVPGQATISVFGTSPISGSHVLALIKFHVAGPPGSVSPLDLVSGAVNEVNACLDDGMLTAVSGALISVPASSCMCVGSEVAVPITLSPGDGVEALGLVLQYDPSLVVPSQVILGPLTSGHGCTLDWNIPSSGQLAIGILCLTPLSGSGTVATPYFLGIGMAPATSALTWLQHDLNEGQIASSSQDGELCLSASAARLAVPDNASGTTGSMLDVPLTGDLPAGTLGVSAVVEWNPSVLTAVTVTPGAGLPADWAVDFDIATPGRATISVFGTTPISGVQVLANIEMSVAGSTGDTTPLDLTFGQVNEVPACLNDGTFYTCALPPSAINDSVRVEKSGGNAVITWTDPPGSYNVYRGGNGPSGGWQYNQSCRFGGVMASAVLDPVNPPVYRCFFYLITRADTCSQEGSMGTDSSDVERPNSHPCGSPAPDTDGDGVENASDNCSAVSNAGQADGDIDGAGNACDNCPAVANRGQEDSDHDGIGDGCDEDLDNDGRDEDGDGSGVAGDNPCLPPILVGCDDNCPGVFNPDQTDSNANGVGDVCEKILLRRD